MEIHLIWAQDNNGGIGKNGKLPWHIPEDLKNFKKLTFNSIIVMGRKTWESLPIKPLPGRRNIVISSRSVKNVECYHSIKKCVDVLCLENVKEIFVIGGGQIYNHFFHRANELHITFINEETKGIDTYFPVSIDKIKCEFNKVNENALGENIIYSHWIRNNPPDDFDDLKV